MKAALLSVACAAGACGPASLQQNGPVVNGRPDAGMDADGKATGNIVVWFGAAVGSTVDDRLDAIDLAADGSTLSFDFFHFNQYGPVHYDLVR